MEMVMNASGKRVTVIAMESQMEDVLVAVDEKGYGIFKDFVLRTVPLNALKPA